MGTNDVPVVSYYRKYLEKIKKKIDRKPEILTAFYSISFVLLWFSVAGIVRWTNGKKAALSNSFSVPELD